MRSLRVDLRIADPDGKIDPMPYRQLFSPVRVAIKSNDTYEFELDLAGGWYLEITLSGNEINGVLTYCKLPIPYSLVDVNGKSTRTNLDGRFNIKVDEMEELHISIIVPVQVCKTLHKFLEAEERKEPKISLAEFLKAPSTKISEYMKLMSTRKEAWRKVAKNIDLESDPIVILLKLWLASILRMAEQAKRSSESESDR